MTYIKACISFIGTVFIYLMGGWDKAIICLLIAMLLDYITGIIKAFKNKKLNSEIGRHGIAKKVYFLCLVALAVIIDNIMGSTGVIRNAIIYYIIANEGLSIIENSAEFGFIVPDVIKNALEQLKDKK